MAQKGFTPVLILVGIIVAATIAGGTYYFLKVKAPAQKACTQEAKICPDGTSVGRSGPNCEFSPCPTITPTPNPDSSLQWQTLESAYGYSISFPNNWYVFNPKSEKGSVDIFSSVKKIPIDSSKDLKYYRDYYKDQIEFLIHASPDYIQNNKTVATYLEELDQAKRLYLQSSPNAPKITEELSREKVTLAGAEGYRRISRSLGSVELSIPEMILIDYYLAHKTDLYIIKIPVLTNLSKEKQELIDQILSTFQFLDQE